MVDSSSHCPVYVRVKPCLDGEESNTSWQPTQVTIGRKSFDFPRAVVPPNADQEALYSLSECDKYCDDLINGYEVNVLAFGQTGSGKTHTIFGPPGLMERAGNGEFGVECVPEYGLMPRVLYRLVDRVEELNAAGQERYALQASAIELHYGQNLDLLYGKCPCFTEKKTKPITMYGQTEMNLASRKDCLRLFAGLATRNTAGTLLNASSSRSHCFATVWLAVADAKGHELRMSRLQFVDMAGNERLNDAHEDAPGHERLRKETERMKQPQRRHPKDGKRESVATSMEGIVTNYSLVMLSKCVRDVVAASSPNENTIRTYMFDLVFLLQSSILGGARTVLYICLRQDREWDSQSLNTLDFGMTFARLRTTGARPAKFSALAKAMSEARTEMKLAEEALAKGVQGKFHQIRHAQMRAARQRLTLLKWLQPRGGSGGGGGGAMGEQCGAASAVGSFAMPGSRFAYELRGEWDAQSAQFQRMLEESDASELFAKSMAERRRAASDWCAYVGNIEGNKRYVRRQSVRELVFHGAAYGSDNRSLRMLIHTAGGGGGGGGDGGGDGGGTAARPALLFFHGGGVIQGTADDYAKLGVPARYAIDSDVVVFNVDFRLAPEFKTPAMLHDGCACVRYVHKHASELGIDASRIGVVGESGGAFVAVGAAMLLAKKGEAQGLVRLLVAVQPQTSDMFHRCSSAELSEMSPHLRLELQKLFMDDHESKIAKDVAAQANDPLLFPNLMAEATAAKMPPTVVMTSEFDFFRLAAEELARKLHRHGRLLDYVVHPCMAHGIYFDMDNPRSKDFWRDSALILGRWLWGRDGAEHEGEQPPSTE